MYKKLSLDEFIETYVGKFGLYQATRVVLIAFMVILETTIFILPIFTAPEVEFRCAQKGPTTQSSTDIKYSERVVTHNTSAPDKLNSSEVPSELSGANTCFVLSPTNEPPANISSPEAARQPCDGFLFSRDVFEYTAIEQHLMVCDNVRRRTLSQSVFFAGQVLGLTFCGVLTDKFGRKWPSAGFSLVQILATAASGFALQFWLFLVLRVLQGVCVCFLSGMMWTLGLELVGISTRPYVSTVMSCTVGLTYFIITPLAMAIRDWRYLQLAAILPHLLGLMCFVLFVPESMRFLMAQGRNSDVRRILRAAAKSNSRTISDTELACLKEDTDHAKISVIHVMRSTRLRIRAIAMTCIWFVAVITYYGSTYNVGNLGGNLFLTSVLGGAVEIFITLLCLVLLRRIGRKKTLAANLLVGAVMWAALIWPMLDAKRTGKRSSSIALITVGTVGRAMSTGTFVVLLLYTPELFPTRARNSVCALCSLVGRAGGILTPLLVDMPNFVKGDIGLALPCIIWCVLSVVGGVLALLVLPETAGTPLPQTIEESENLGKLGSTQEKERSPAKTAEGTSLMKDNLRD